ncbi:uncharacterized protein LOC5505102 isoform X2 [Nematostella vectensis]|uniref:uncharacterized protein LOC5505102 isoform X2 n=1 Tax=Nematostella vectensis TaxID=45351 RepID=UPI00138FE30B|nr:uncharacterized protein LOC5505102 isoform X2 [Nematostella vectensis]
MFDNHKYKLHRKKSMEMVHLRDQFSLADIYEGALRKVLNIQLNLKIDEQPKPLDENDFTTNKMSPPRPKALRLEDLKQRDVIRHRERAPDENDPRSFPQGHTNLRQLGERNSEGSAFHVPPKRRFDAFPPPLDRDPGYPRDRFGMVPSHRFHSHVTPFGMDPTRNPRLAVPYGYGPRGGTTQETYSRYSSHQREIPPLFPVRCSSKEREELLLSQRKEQEHKEQKSPDVKRSPDVRRTPDDARAHKSPDVPRRSPDVPNRYNGVHEKSPWRDGEERKIVIKSEREDVSYEKLNLEEKFNSANDRITSLMRSGSVGKVLDRRSPFSLRFRPYGSRVKYSPGLTNGNSESLDAERNVKKEVSKTGEEGDKEEFLSSLGLARIAK